VFAPETILPEGAEYQGFCPIAEVTEGASGMNGLPALSRQHRLGDTPEPKSRAMLEMWYTPR